MKNEIKICCISDTHSLHVYMTKDVEEACKECDILIHAGDESDMNRYSDKINENKLRDFLSWYNSFDVKYKIFIAGNHSWLFETNNELARKILKDYPNIIYLQDSGVEIEGIKIWGSPWQPEFFNWAFNVKRGPSIRKYWDKIPDDTNILITHSPPYGYGDEVPYSYYNPETNVGCRDLLDRINELKDLKINVFGHIHHGYSVKKHKDGKDITFINAAMLDDDYRYTHKPTIITYKY